jgi:hypothetical protein
MPGRAPPGQNEQHRDLIVEVLGSARAVGRPAAGDRPVPIIRRCCGPA